MKNLRFFFVLLLLSCLSLAAKKPSPLIRCTTRPCPITQGLQDRQIALWASHGLYYHADADRWRFQRARVWTTVEDLFTSSFTAPYLVPMLENAGAIVFQPRAYVRPSYQTIYVRWPNQTKKKLQMITLSQGSYTASYQVNTSQGIGLWHYLCTLPKGAYTLTGAESMAIDESTLGSSGYPRFMEAARYWVPELGIPDSVWVTDTTYNDYLNDIVCRGGALNYLLSQNIQLDLSVALHTDAGTTMNDSLIGSMGIYTHPEDLALADTVLHQLVSDLQTLYTPQWPLRELRLANYGETRIPEVPSLLLEVLSHQNYADMSYALNPRFRHDVARAIYKGIGRFFASRRKPFVPTPLAPNALHTYMDGDSVYLTWTPPVDTLEPLARPTYYVVYTRYNDSTWDAGTYVSSPSFSLPLSLDVHYDFAVAAGNAGGLSLRSPIVSAYRSYANDLPLLIVDAFSTVSGPAMMAFDSLTGGIVPGARPIPDGLEMAYIGQQLNYRRWDPWHSDDDCGFGMCSMQLAGQLLVGNTHDYAAQHGRVWRNHQRSFVSCTAEALTINDSNYYQVDLILGKIPIEQVRKLFQWTHVLNWTRYPHNVLISGAYIGYPYNACAAGQIMMNGQRFSFRQELNPTRLSAENVSAVSRLAESDTILARYTDTGLPAIIRNENYTLVGFPLECLDDFDLVLPYLLFAPTGPVNTETDSPYSGND